MWFGRAPAIVKKLAKSIGYSMVLAVGSSVCLPGYEFHLWVWRGRAGVADEPGMYNFIDSESLQFRDQPDLTRPPRGSK